MVHKFYSVVAIGFFLLFPAIALSNGLDFKDIGDMSCGVQRQMPEFSVLTSIIAAVIGLVFVGAGILKFKEHAHGNQPGAPNGPLKLAIVMVVAGGLLTSIGFMSLVASNTLFDTNTGSLDDASDARDGNAWSEYAKNTKCKNTNRSGSFTSPKSQ